MLNLFLVIKPENDKWKPGHEQKHKLEESEKKELLNNPNKHYPLIIHAKTEDKKASTEVNFFDFCLFMRLTLRNHIVSQIPY
jgi:hypothetical protein